MDSRNLELSPVVGLVGSIPHSLLLFLPLPFLPSPPPYPLHTHFPTFPVRAQIPERRPEVPGRRRRQDLCAPAEEPDTLKTALVLNWDALPRTLKIALLLC
eukprot:651532-Pleurochrysis_carterae.AAC.1